MMNAQGHNHVPAGQAAPAQAAGETELVSEKDKKPCPLPQQC